MAYHELIKDFSSLRQYIGEFFIYGFRNRNELEVHGKSGRSYDDIRRRIQSYLGELVSFRHNSFGKNIYISLDGRSQPHNPLYRAFKCKSFTDKDIIFFFFVMDILQDNLKHTLKNIIENLENKYFTMVNNCIEYDESTLRKKLTEYVNLGIIQKEKHGRELVYKASSFSMPLFQYRHCIRFFTEESPLGVIGSYLEDKMTAGQEYLLFKYHYIMNAYDTEILAKVLQGIHKKRFLRFLYVSQRSYVKTEWEVIPFKLYISTQGGRNYLLAKCGSIYKSFRIDYIREISIKERVQDYDECLTKFMTSSVFMWGVNNNIRKRLEHVLMDIYVGENEEYIIKRLYRERRNGKLKQINPYTYRFEISVFDAYEMIPWIRTFFGRIVQFKCDNPAVSRNLARDLRIFYEEMLKDDFS